MTTELPSFIFSQYLWYKRTIQVNNAPVYFIKFSKKISIMFCNFSDNGSIKQWNELNKEHNLRESFYFQWLQLIDSLPQRWKIIITENYTDAINLIIFYYHLVKGSRDITLNKLISTEIYSILTPKSQNNPSSNIYFKNLYNEHNINWTAICMLPRLVTYTKS